MTLKDLKVYQALSFFEPRVVGTIPLGVNIAGSDIDVVCESYELDDFVEIVSETYWGKSGFAVSEPVIHGMPAAVCRFEHKDIPIEIFCQQIPVHQQYGYRHFMIEKRVLTIHGDRARNEIRDYKMEGLNTEAAFCKFLCLPGDGYEALLAVDEMSDEQVEALRPKETRTVNVGKKRHGSEVGWSS